MGGGLVSVCCRCRTLLTWCTAEGEAPVLAACASAVSLRTPQHPARPRAASTSARTSGRHARAGSERVPFRLSASCLPAADRPPGAPAAQYLIPDILAAMPLLLYQGATDAQDGPATNEPWIYSLAWCARSAARAARMPRRPGAWPQDGAQSDAQRGTHADARRHQIPRA
jgi:hypothetical protein